MELGIKQLKAGNYFDAALRFKFVLWMNKRNVIAHYLLGKSYFYRGKFAECVPPLKEALRLQPDFEEAKFLLTCAGANTGIKAIPRSFIIDKLDQISLNYDQYVQNTSSQVNAVLAEELKKLTGENMGFNVLDLGARGGDTAQILRSVSNSVIGVEPSLKLVSIARSRRINNLLAYNQIAGRFPEDYLRECKDHFSIVLCTYYLDNLGPLDEFFKLVSNVTEDKGIFAFNISVHNGNEDYFFKTSSILFAHSPAYVEKLLEKSGFKIISRREVKYASGATDMVYVTVKK